MEKLELKHLSAYLPYRLKMDSYGRKYILTGFILESSLNVKDKPILRQLSDLTKEIEISGEMFIPIEKLKEIFDFDFNGDGFELTNDLTIIYTSYSDTEGFMFPSNFWINVYQKLFEWHFDVFGLIENNLAININTLNK
jgi:hypothetical protein